EGGAVLEDGVVLAAAIGLAEGHQGHAGGVVGQLLVVDAAVALDALRQVIEALGDDGVVGAVAVAQQAGDDDGGDAGAGDARREAAVLALVLLEVVPGLLDQRPHLLGVGAGRAGGAGLERRGQDGGRQGRASHTSGHGCSPWWAGRRPILPRPPVLDRGV